MSGNPASPPSQASSMGARSSGGALKSGNETTESVASVSLGHRSACTSYAPASIPSTQLNPFKPFRVIRSLRKLRLRRSAVSTDSAASVRFKDGSVCRVEDLDFIMVRPRADSEALLHDS